MILKERFQAVLRCILAYFDNKSPEELPYLNVPLHTVIKLTPKAYSCHIEMFKFKVDAVDTYREKPSDSNTPLVNFFLFVLRFTVEIYRRFMLNFGGIFRSMLFRDVLNADEKKFNGF